MISLQSAISAAWSRDFVGLPKLHAGRSPAGVDCYGLLWLVYRDVLDIALPSYTGETLDCVERAEIAGLIARGRAVAPWLPVEIGSERAFDMAVFRRGDCEAHVGIVVAPGRMLHVVDGQDSHVVSFAAGPWRRRLVSLHRHEALA